MDDGGCVLLMLIIAVIFFMGRCSVQTPDPQIYNGDVCVVYHGDIYCKIGEK